MKFISLFAGIGGLDLGLERAGMRCVAQVEIDEYANKVLAKHWPDVPRFRDVRECGRHNLPSADLICGGFPCQDLSYAGKGAGIDGERSGLWREYYRIICELRPRYVLVENVTALTARGFDRVLGQLSEARYDAEWSVLPACALGSPHSRSRLFLVAHAHEKSQQRGEFLPERGEAQACEWRSPERGKSGQFTAMGAEGDTRLRSLAEWWRVEPGMGRMVARVPRRLDRLGAVGNSVVPQVAEFIGRRIMELEH